MSEIGIHGCFILDVRKKTNGCDINLDKDELTLFVGRVSNESNGVAGKVEMDLRSINDWVHRDPGLMVPMVDMVLALMPTIKPSKKLSKLKTWLGAPVILGLLGKEVM
jgi:hypothetical protein